MRGIRYTLYHMPVYHKYNDMVLFDMWYWQYPNPNLPYPRAVIKDASVADDFDGRRHGEIFQ